eukprot:TRINITY_DN5594_c0_g1_i1.p1 TRINITY_DN5594_c0_g1~~TRINITY_DN5594_c0_g1_i1.p1  ORF type:complete len:362 (+),score=139.78 TRINITY_DN5594_c0_g1_i1:105-1088(+)
MAAQELSRIQQMASPDARTAAYKQFITERYNQGDAVALKQAVTHCSREGVPLSEGRPALSHWAKVVLFVHEEEGKGEEDRPLKNSVLIDLARHALRVMGERSVSLKEQATETRQQLSKIPQDGGPLKIANPGAACVAPEQRAPAPGAAVQRKGQRQVLQQLPPNVPTAAVDRSGEGLLQLRVLRERARALQEQHDGLLAQRRDAQAAAQQQKVLLAQRADRAQQQTQRWREEAERWYDAADQDRAKLWAWLWVLERAEDIFGRPGSMPPHQAEQELRQAATALAHGNSAVDLVLREGMLGDPAPAPRQGWLQMLAQRAWTVSARFAR